MNDLAYYYRWIIILPLQLIVGCGAMRNGRGWGQDATLLPGAQRIGQAAMKAVSDPKTWAPAAGAAFLGLSSLDQEISQWASNHTPVFGSREGAVEWSGRLRRGSKIAWVSTTLITPSGNNLQEIAFAKCKGIAIEALAISAAKNVTGALKKTTRRQRPNDFDDESFPSADASDAFVYSFLAVKNLDATPVHRRFKIMLDAGLLTMASATAWARVEAQAHYPSDVLFSMALANFMAVFFTEAFMGIDSEAPVNFRLIPGGKETLLQLRVQF